MELIGEFFADIFFRRLIVRILGIRTRYYFLKIFNKNLQLEDLRGKEKDVGDQVSQDFYNAVIGILALAVLVVGIGYLVYEVF